MRTKIAVVSLINLWGSACSSVEGNDVLEDRCVQPQPWAAGTRLFAERSDLGLQGISGQRISAVDVDGDGDADLIVRKGGATANDVSLAQEDPARTGWLMLNDGRGHFSDGSAALISERAR